jgi:hypothetical protein
MRLPRNCDFGVIKREIDRFKDLDREGLLRLWRKEFKHDGRGLSRDLLFRMLAWRLQEKAFGGYGRTTESALKRYARDNGNLGGEGTSRLARTGTVLVREYQGVRHTVTVVPDGFVWQERVYSTLSKVANEITGTKWNGPRFFGLRPAKSRLLEARRMPV